MNRNVCIRFSMILVRLPRFHPFCANLQEAEVLRLPQPRAPGKPAHYPHVFTRICWTPRSGRSNEIMHPILAIGRTGDSPARRIARPRVRNPASPTSHRICDIARYSTTPPPTGSESSHIGQRSYGGVRLGRDENGHDERRDVRIRHQGIDVPASHCEQLSAPSRA